VTFWKTCLMVYCGISALSRPQIRPYQVHTSCIVQNANSIILTLSCSELISFWKNGLQLHAFLFQGEYFCCIVATSCLQGGSCDVKFDGKYPSNSNSIQFTRVFCRLSCLLSTFSHPSLPFIFIDTIATYQATASTSPTFVIYPGTEHTAFDSLAHDYALPISAINHRVTRGDPNLVGFVERRSRRHGSHTNSYQNHPQTLHSAVIPSKHWQWQSWWVRDCSS